MDSQKAANWAQITGTFIGALLLAYVVWDHLPAANQSPIGVGWGGAVKGYVPPASIALILFASAVLQVIASRRRHPQAKSAVDTDNANPTLEILSPFDNEDVGLYEIVRGRVFPPDSNLQVLVFAGDKKWYRQRAAQVKGSLWSVKCQFGNTDGPGGGAYKIVAIFGSESNKVSYADLPAGTKSNIVHLRRREITIEQKLSAALKEAKNANLRANEEKNSKDTVYGLYQDSQRQLAQWSWLTKMAEDQSIAIDHHVALDRITLGEIRLKPSNSVVSFGIHVTNKSVLDVSLAYDLDAPVGGMIEFRDFDTTRLLGTKVVVNTVKDLPPGGSGCLTIEQRLIDDEPKAIHNAQSSSHAYFDFAGLIVNIVGGKRSPNITSRPLVMRNESVIAYPVDLLTRGNRIKALSRVFGSSVQLYEPLRKGNNPLSKRDFEYWEGTTRETLNTAYGEVGGKRVFDEITRKEAFPEGSAGFQRNWLEFCFVILEDLIAKEIQAIQRIPGNA